MQAANVQVATNVMVKARELGLGLDIVKHGTPPKMFWVLLIL
jgi:hypothetical protein